MRTTFGGWSGWKRVALATAVFGLACCAREGQPAAPAAGPPAAEGGEQEADPGGDRVWGLLSEDEFKSLHELGDERRPAPRGEMVDLDGSRAYLSVPEGPAPHPAVLVIHEWWGLNDHIKYWADRLAADGYAALAVDLYEGRTAADADRAMELMKAVDDERAHAVLAAGHRFLAEDERVQSSARAALGWCFGGGWSLRAGLALEPLDAVVMYYGQVMTEAEELQGLEAPLLGIFANEDEAITPAQVDAFDQALDEVGVTHTILRYDADHAFANPSGARYDREAAEAAWGEVRSFLGEHLRSGR